MMSVARLRATLLSFAIIASTWTSTPACATGADATLDPYRTLARTPDAQRILAFTRAAIDRALGSAAGDTSSIADSTNADSLAWPGAPTGVIVSLAHGATTRACVGTLTPLGGELGWTLEHLAGDVIAADPRHPPIRQGELQDLRVVVAFTSAPVSVADPMQVSPSREGLLITTTRGSVAFLPGEAKTISWALGEARRAGILGRAADAGYQRFSAVILQEPNSAPSRPLEEPIDASP